MVVWPKAFERMNQFIQDTNLGPDDLNMTYDDVIDMFQMVKLLCTLAVLPV